MRPGSYEYGSVRASPRYRLESTLMLRLRTMRTPDAQPRTARRTAPCACRSCRSAWARGLPSLGLFDPLLHSVAALAHARGARRQLHSGGVVPLVARSPRRSGVRPRRMGRRAHIQVRSSILSGLPDSVALALVILLPRFTQLVADLAARCSLIGVYVDEIAAASWSPLRLASCTPRWWTSASCRPHRPRALHAWRVQA